MRHIQLRVPNEELDRLTAALEEKDIDFVVLEGVDATADSRIVEFPLPTDAVGDILDAVRDAGIDDETYTVIGAAEAAMSPNNETLMRRYADDFDPLSRPELRSKARDMSRDPASYYAMLTLSAVIATTGLLVGSPAVIVGSMVIAPFVGPILTTGVGTVTNDREMVVDSLFLQGWGLALSIGAAMLFAYVVKSASLLPQLLDIMAIDSIATRIAPNFPSMAVGLAAGGAAAYSLATKGPTGLIGVMIAAALIPAAATVGIGIVWGFPLVAFGTLLLLVASVVAINAGVLVTLYVLGYRPSGGNVSLGSLALPDRGVLLALVVLFGVVGGAFGAATVEHVAFERNVNRAVHDTLAGDRYAALSVVSVRPQYGGPSPVDAEPAVVVALSGSASGSYPEVAAEIERRIREMTGRDVDVRVQMTTYRG